MTSASRPASAASSLSRWRVNSSRLVGVGAAAVEVGVAAARAGAGVARRGVERDEEVERVHRRDPERAADGLGRRRPRVRRGVVGGAGRVDAVEAEVEAEDADGVRRPVAAAEPVVERERLAVRVAQDRRVLGALDVVERDPAQAVRGGPRVRRPRRARRSPSRVNGRGLAVERQREDDLAEAVVVEVLGDDERLREADEHALVALGIRRRGERHGHVGGVDLPVPQSTMFAAGTAAVLLFEPLSVVWLKRSRAKPVTRTKSPTLTVFAPPVKTKMPSEVAASPSPVGVLEVEARVGGGRPRSRRRRRPGS